MSSATKGSHGQISSTDGKNSIRPAFIDGGMVHHIQGHRDIKSSSKLPQAFRIMRTNQSKHMILNSKHKSSIKHSQQVLNNQVNQAVKQYIRPFAPGRTSSFCNSDHTDQIDKTEWQKNISETQMASAILESADLNGSTLRHWALLVGCVDRWPSKWYI